MTLLEETQLLTVGEVALRLRQTERTVRDKIASGEIRAVKIGSGPRAPIRVRLDELQAWLYGLPLPAPRPATGAVDVAAGRPSEGQEGHDA